MRILALIGSLRKGSYNRKVFEQYRDIAADRVEIVEGQFAEFPLYNEDIRENGMPQSVLDLAEQIRAADAVIFFSPEYNYSIPGLVKNMIDWLSKVPDQPFSGKPVSIVSASPGRFGGARMQYHLRQVGVTLDMRFLNRPEVMISEVHKKVNEQGEWSDPETLGYLRKHFEKFQEFVKHGNH